MKYLIKPPMQERGNYMKKNYGEIYTSGGILRLNLIATGSYREEVKEMFVEIVSMLATHFTLIEQIKRKGSTKGITSTSKNELEVEDLMEGLKSKFPELKNKIENYKKYHKEYQKEWKKTRKKRFKKCFDCDKKITWNAKRCHSCASKHVKKIKDIKTKRGKKK